MDDIELSLLIAELTAENMIRELDQKLDVVLHANDSISGNGIGQAEGPQDNPV